MLPRFSGVRPSESHLSPGTLLLNCHETRNSEFPFIRRMAFSSLFLRSLQPAVRHILLLPFLAQFGVRCRCRTPSPSYPPVGSFRALLRSENMPSSFCTYSIYIYFISPLLLCRTHRILLFWLQGYFLRPLRKTIPFSGRSSRRGCTRGWNENIPKLAQK